jgi:hypothetical protein
MQNVRKFVKNVNSGIEQLKLHYIFKHALYCDMHAGGVTVDVAWQRTRTQQSLMQHWKQPEFSLWSVPVMTSCNSGGFLDGVLFGV